MAVQTMAGFHKRGVSFVDFSPTGNLLGSVGLDNDFSVAVYKVKEGTLVASAKGGGAKILGLCWSSSGVESDFATVGVKQVDF
jgi:WD40 repeat protein